VEAMYKLKIINWNIGGAKYLELKSEDSPNYIEAEESREQFRTNLNNALALLIRRERPSIVMLFSVKPNA
jgi:hypothetical protein